MKLSLGPRACSAVRLAIVLGLLPTALAACSLDTSPSGAANGSCVPDPASMTAFPRDLSGLNGTGAAGAIEAVPAFGANPGGLSMYVHAPASGAASAIVVALHGCTQSASAYVSAGWNELADKAGIAVVYAEQPSSNNMQRCFRWWEPLHTKRGQGEAASIAAMTEWAKKKYGATKAYVTGLSAGGAMTAVMLAAYPDLFEAGAVMAGLPYACATSQNDAYTCMSPGKDKAPSDWAALLPAAARGAGAPRVSIWHGDADYTVRPANAEALARQWTAANGVAATPTATETVSGATHDVYKDASGVTKVEKWIIKGMSHAVALDPKNGCGKAGAYLLDKGICSTAKAAVFFGVIADDAAPSAPPPAGSSGAGGSSGGASSGGSSGVAGSGSQAGSDCN